MKRFLFIGDANIDIVVNGMKELPVLGQEISCAGISMLLGGSTAICASFLASLGASVTFWGKVGGDKHGEFVLRELEDRQIDIRHVMVDPDIRTGVCVSLSFRDDRALISYLGSIASLRLEDIPLEQIGKFDHLHSGSIFIQHGLQPGFRELFQKAKEANLTTSLDSGWDPLNRWETDLHNILPYVDYFLPNEVEALRLTGTGSVEEAAVKLGQYGSTVVIKQGELGALGRSGSNVWQVPSFKIDLTETTGAGDCFNAGLIYALIERGLTLFEALKFANGCGAICASSPGGTTASPSAEQVDRFMAADFGNAA